MLREALAMHDAVIGDEEHFNQILASSAQCSIACAQIANILICSSALQPYVADCIHFATYLC